MMVEKAHTSRLNGRRTHCYYCGRILKDNTVPGAKYSGDCKICKTKLQWLLECIRFSKKIVEYVEKTEAREASRREERNKKIHDELDVSIKEQTAIAFARQRCDAEPEFSDVHWVVTDDEKSGLDPDEFITPERHLEAMQKVILSLVTRFDRLERSLS